MMFSVGDNSRQHIENLPEQHEEYPQTVHTSPCQHQTQQAADGAEALPCPDSHTCEG
jgi:hypothetical protein